MPLPRTIRCTCGPSLALGAERRSGGRKTAPLLFLLIGALGHPLGAGRTAWPWVPTSRGEGTGRCLEEPRGNRVSPHRNPTPQRGGLLPGLCSPLQNPTPHPATGTPNRAIPATGRAGSLLLASPLPSSTQRQLTLALEQRPLANSFGASHLAPATSPLAHPGYFWCSSPAGGHPRFAQGAWTPPGAVPRRQAWRPVRLALIPPAAAKLPGWAAHARPTSRGPDVRQRLTQTSPAMCTQPRPGKNPPPR